MQLLLGLFFFSVLLTAGNSLLCEDCTSQTSDCTGTKKECAIDNGVCMALTTELDLGGHKTEKTKKDCSTKDACKLIEDLKGKTGTSQTPLVTPGSIIKRIVCSRAPPAFASLIPAFLGLLLMKLLF